MRTTPYAIALVLLSACTIHTRSGPANNPPPPPPPGPVAAAPAPAPGPAPAPAPADPGQPIAVGNPYVAPAVIGAPATPGFDPLPPNQPPVIDPPAPIVQPVPVPPNLANGQPPNMKPGAPGAYWIWRDGNGWHLRSTTAKQLQRFHGKITTDVTQVTPVRLEMKDRLKATTKWILFNFDTAGHMDGFDFKANGCATFNLSQNGNKKIFVGSSEMQPSSNHFTLCP